MIALFGAEGGIGRRYQCILNYIQEPFIPIEKDDELEPERWTKAIVATPTQTHFEVAEFLKDLQIPFLLEKPPCLTIPEAIQMGEWVCEGSIVNNYNFVPRPKGLLKHITWDFYNSGKDGLKWDVCQLLHIAAKEHCSIEVARRSPYWKLVFNDERMPYEAIEDSYLSMVLAFLDGDKEDLWSLKEALPMTKAVLAVDDSLGSIFHEFT